MIACFISGVAVGSLVAKVGEFFSTEEVDEIIRELEK